MAFQRRCAKQRGCRGVGRKCTHRVAPSRPRPPAAMHTHAPCPGSAARLPRWGLVGLQWRVRRVERTGWLPAQASALPVPGCNGGLQVSNPASHGGSCPVARIHSAAVLHIDVHVPGRRVDVPAARAASRGNLRAGRGSCNCCGHNFHPSHRCLVVSPRRARLTR